MAGAIQVAGRPLDGRRPFFILGPCVIESLDLCLSVADHLAELARRLEVE
ncbi:MAG: 3-deoxy-8-phosphooctulonate synthase, partial [Deltaproteobacteria bacterium]|nr:3-deoxy-8-phosphooctulonate synthase [Deltaproteobacteria bacterium]